MRKENTSPLIVTILAVISLACISVGVSYSYLSKISSSNVTANIQTGNLNATLSYVQITDGALVPLSDSDGVNQTTYAKVSISKNNQYTVFYTINISYSVDSLSSYGITTDDLLPLEYVRVALFDSIDSNIPLVGPIAITELPLQSVDTINHYKDIYTLAFGNFIAGSDTKDYYIKAWLDPITPEINEGRSILLDVNITQNPLVSTSIYNLSGNVTVDGTAVTGAVVSLQNGLVNSTTSNGAFNLTNVPIGTYNLSVNYNNNKYETTVNISSGSSENVSARSSATCEAGSYLQNCAFTYFTTVDKIVKMNSITSGSNTQLASSYNLPTSYLITGTESISVLDISGINIAVSTASNSVTLSK